MTNPQSSEPAQAPPRIDRKGERLLAAVAVGGGIGQLLLLRWLESNFPRNTAVSIAGVVFLLYFSLVIWLIRRRGLRQRHRI